MARKMAPKPKRRPLEAKDIQAGKTYRGKNPTKVGFFQEVNDRYVLRVSSHRLFVQYDSPAVKDGSQYPTVTMEDFLQWASHEVF